MPIPLRIPELDGLRAIAILAVLAVHSYGRIYGGYLGVDLFFVLSGFLITSVLMRDASLPRFYGRRALRILPPLIAAMGLTLALARINGHPQLMPVALFYANFVPRENIVGLGHTWSLAIEEQFYALWPLLFLFLGRWRVAVLASAIVAVLVLRLVLVGTVDDEYLYRATFTRADSLAAGCLVALTQFRGNRALGYACLAAAIACFAFAERTALIVSVGFTLFAVVCVGLVGSARELPILRIPALQWLGKRSYGVYLYHLPIFMALAPLQDPGRKLEWLGIAAAKVALAVLVAEISYRTIERWSERLKGHFQHGIQDKTAEDQVIRGGA